MPGEPWRLSTLRAGATAHQNITRTEPNAYKVREPDLVTLNGPTDRESRFATVSTTAFDFLSATAACASSLASRSNMCILRTGQRAFWQRQSSLPRSGQSRTSPPLTQSGAGRLMGSAPSGRSKRPEGFLSHPPLRRSRPRSCSLRGPVAQAPTPASASACADGAFSNVCAGAGDATVHSSPAAPSHGRAGASLDARIQRTMVHTSRS